MTLDDQDDMGRTLRTIKFIVTLFYGTLLCVIGTVSYYFIQTHEGDYARLTTAVFVLVDPDPKHPLDVIFKSGKDTIRCSAREADSEKLYSCKING